MTWPGLPLLLKFDAPVILLGDGEAADAKRRLLERAGATVVDDAPDARLAIVAIEDEADAHAAVARLRARGVLVNAVDRPSSCDVTLPAVVDRAPLLVAVMTGGVSAGLAAAVRQRLEALLPASLGELAAELYDHRRELRERWPDAQERRRMVMAALAPGGFLDPFGPYSRDDLVWQYIVTASEDSVTDPIHIALASPDPDDLTLRHARALALAERVFHAAAVPSAILARARADATRIASDTAPAQMEPGDVWIEMA